MNAETHPDANGTPIGKGKERRRSSSHSKPLDSVQPSDLLAIASEQKPHLNGVSDKKPSNVSESDKSLWEEWGSVQMRYYQPPSISPESAKISTPTTPTPTRRPSNLSRSSRPSSAEDSPDNMVTASTSKAEEASQGGMKSLDISLSKISTTPVPDILKETLPNIPKDHQYDLLTRLRVAHAMTTSLTTQIGRAHV